jgi:hypothetical protein
MPARARNTAFRLVVTDCRSWAGLAGADAVSSFGLPGRSATATCLATTWAAPSRV